METISIQLKPETVAKVDQKAQRDGRPRSQYIRRILEREVGDVTGENRLADLEQIAADNLREPDEAPGPHAGEVIAAASVDGKAMLAAHKSIAPSRQGKRS